MCVRSQKSWKPRNIKKVSINSEKWKCTKNIILFEQVNKSTMWIAFNFLYKQNEWHATASEEEREWDWARMSENPRERWGQVLKIVLNS